MVIEIQTNQGQHKTERNQTMAITGPMRYELTKYRRGKIRSMKGIVPGVPYPYYKRPTTRPLDSRSRTRSPIHHDLYNWGMSRDYHPRLNVPAVQSTEYDAYEPFDMPRVPRPKNPALFRHFPENDQEPLLMSIPQDDLPLSEQLRQAKGKSDEIGQVVLGEPSFDINEQNLDNTFDDSESTIQFRSVDALPSLEDLSEALSQLTGVFPEDHPDIINLRMAISTIEKHQGSMSEMDGPESDMMNVQPEDIGIGMDYSRRDPHEEAEQFFEQQMQILEKSFDEPVEVQAQDMLEDQIMGSEMVFDEAIAAQEGLEDVIQQEDAFDTPGPEPMEQEIMPDEITADMGIQAAVIEPAEYDVDVVADEINQAIDGAAGQPMPEEQEPDPFQMQYDPFGIMNQMFDQQMQYMANPMMTPPGLGPMGPMPGPGM